MDVLPDDVLLAIFDFYVDSGTIQGKMYIEAWQTLVHVCRRWRCVVFGSPRRLNLRLVCTPRTPARESLDIWPALPLVVEGSLFSTSADNIIVALGHRDRVYRIDLLVYGGLEWDRVLAAMRVPFPALTHLLLQTYDQYKDEPESVIPDAFLGGSAPRLEYLTVGSIPFLGIPNLLMSATHLVNLDFSRIPHFGYISPEVMATCLSVLTSLDTLSLGFLSSRSRPDRESRRLPPMTRSILPALTNFCFNGTSEYLEDLVARIDAPRLDFLPITFLDQINFNTPHTPHLVQFISRTPSFEEPNEAHVSFDLSAKAAEVRLLWKSDDNGRLRVKIPYEGSGQQLPSVTQVCASCLPPLSTVENLRLGVNINSLYSILKWIYGAESGQWLELLRPFTAVKSLYLSPYMMSALRALVGDRTMEVLPSLRNIYLESEESGSFREAIGRFVAARQLSGHPIAIFYL